MEDINLNEINKVRIFYFGLVMVMLIFLFCEIYLSFIFSVKEEGKFIFFDFNYWRDLWKGRLIDFILIVKKVIVLSDFVKVSDEELEIIIGIKNYEVGVDILYKMGVKIVVVIFGKRGILIFNSRKKELVKSIFIKLIDFIGVGDVFVGVMLFKLVNI